MNSKYDYAECLRSGWATPSEIHGAADLIDQLHDQLALAEQQRDAAVEGLEDDIEEIEPAIHLLQTSPKECLGITGDDSNSWPIRDELISNLKKRVKKNRDTLARIRELGEKGGES